MTHKSFLPLVFAGLTLVPAAASAFPSSSRPGVSASRPATLRQRIGNRLGGGMRSLLNRRSTPAGATPAQVGAVGAHFVEPGTRIGPNGTQIQAHGIQTVHPGNHAVAAMYTQRVELSGGPHAGSNGAPHIVSEQYSRTQGHVAVTSHAARDSAGRLVRQTTVTVAPPGSAAPGSSETGMRELSNGTREFQSHSPGLSSHEITHADGSGFSRVTNHEAGFTNTRVQHAAGSSAQLHESRTVLHADGSATVHSSGRAGANGPVYHDELHYQAGSQGAQALHAAARR